MAPQKPQLTFLFYKTGVEDMIPRPCIPNHEKFEQENLKGN
uniref:Uncharacterized protein n=1 Tax=Anguilla anguilla TaxID=7936 RepID=A0A0E9V3W1_ANGAN